MEVEVLKTVLNEKKIQCACSLSGYQFADSAKQMTIANIGTPEMREHSAGEMELL
jgi:hypothetical protein